MNDISIKQIQLALSEETEQGTPATLAATDFVEVTENPSFNGSRDKIEINTLKNSNLTGKRSKKTSQNGDGSFNVYLRAGEEQGDTPEIDLMLRSAGFSKETVSTVTELLAGSTTSILKIDLADLAKYKIGQGILIDNTHKNVIVDITSDLDEVSLHLLITLPSPPAEGVEIAKLVNYRLDDKTNKSFTARKFFNGKVKQEIPGCKVTELSATFSPREAVTMACSFQGLNFFETLYSLVTSAVYNTAEVPVAMKACLYKNGVDLDATEFSFTVAPSVTKKSSLCAENGYSGQRAVDYAVSGSASVYKKDNDISIKPGDDKYSFFISIHIPAANGEVSNVMCVYIPSVKIDEVDNNGDTDGLSSQSISWVMEQDNDTTDCMTITSI